MATTKPVNRDWADDDEDELPPQTITQNKDGSKTVTTYSINENGKKVKTTRRIKTRIIREVVNPRVAERKEWKKFGLEQNKPQGPSTDTTTVGENIMFKPSVTWRSDLKDTVKKAEDDSMRDKLRDKKVKCRICEGEHYTMKCPFKDTMAPAGETDADGETRTGATEAMLRAINEEDAGGKGGGGGTQSSYVPPHLRKGAGAGAGERMSGGKYERDDLATLRVTNVSEMADEQDLRAIFERFGRVSRVFLAKDRETGRAKGFAFISYVDRTDAVRACEKLDGYLYEYLVLKVEFAKRAT